MRKHHLADKASVARFIPLKFEADTPSVGARLASRALAALDCPFDVVILGMGEDGHTASLFPRMQNLDQALAAAAAYVPVDATGCPVAGKFLRRISLTPAGLAPAHTRLLLIRGESKRRLLERVLDGDDALEYPVRIGFTTPGADLHIHWCP